MGRNHLNGLAGCALAATVACVAAADGLHAATVDRVLIRQQWPWNTSVRVDYRLLGVTEAVDVVPTFYNGETELAAPGFATNYVGDVKYVTADGDYSFTFDPKAAFDLADGAKIDDLRVRLSLVPTTSPASYADKLYRVVDLDTGAITDLTRGDFYNHKYGAFETSYMSIKGKAGGTYTTTLDDEFIWTGVTNNPAYKTTKMVFRYVNCKNRVWTQGCDNKYSGNGIPGAAPAHAAMFTSNYYIGVFKVTQDQYHRLTGSYAGSYLHVTNDATRLEDHRLPIYNTYRKTVRGVETQSPPTANSFFGKFMALTGNRLVADIPTDAQWEYAGRGECEVGSGSMPNGSTSFAYIAHANSANKAPAPVGCYQPNALGLYDVMGNGYEMVYDDYIAFTAEAFLSQTNAAGVVVDPMGPHTGSGNVLVKGAGFAPTSTGAGNRFACLFHRPSNRTSGQDLFSFRVRLDDDAPESASSSAPSSAGAEASAPAEIVIDSDVKGPFWQTATGTAFTVNWEMPPLGAPATLTVVGLRGKALATYEGLTGGSCDVTVPSDGSTEDLLTLTLDFSDDTSVTAKLGRVTGSVADGDTTTGTRCLENEASSAWTTVSRTAVGVVPENARTLTIGGASADVTPGMTWFGVGLLKGGVAQTLGLTVGNEDGSTNTIEKIVYGERFGSYLMIR